MFLVLDISCYIEQKVSIQNLYSKLNLTETKQPHIVATLQEVSYAHAYRLGLYFVCSITAANAFVFIPAGYSDQFDKYSWTTIDDLGKDYDYQSIMHYDRRAFTKNGLPTIVNIYDESMVFGTGDKKLSQKDIIEINALYDCHSSIEINIVLIFLFFFVLKKGILCLKRRPTQQPNRKMYYIRY